MHPVLSGEDGLKAALGKMPSGLYVAGATTGGQRLGMLCSFVEQAGFKPPTVTVSLGADRPLRRALDAGALFSLNILGSGDKDLLAAFASGREEDPFSAFPLFDNTLGLPQLAGALAWLACRPLRSVDAGDHVVFVAEVLEGCLHRESGEPMIRVRKNGFGY